METQTSIDKQREALLLRRGIRRVAPDLEPLSREPKREKPDAEQILRQVRDLPALPGVVVKIMRMTARHENPSPRKLAEVISADPSFTARIMKMANSAYYGLPRSVSTVPDAVMMLGNVTVRNMALVAATQDIMQHCVPGYELQPGELWRHSVSCAWAVNLLAEQAHYPDKEEAFVAGLLHDVGKIILGPHIATWLFPIQKYREQTGCRFVEAEAAVLGFDHAEIGGRMALAWNLPAILAQAIRWHHAPSQNGYIAPMTALVYLGNILCTTVGASSPETEIHTQIHAGCLHTLNLTEAQISNTIQQLSDYIAELPASAGE